MVCALCQGLIQIHYRSILMKFTKFIVAASLLMASIGAMAVDVDPCTNPNGCATGLGTPVDDMAMLGLAVAALAAGVAVIRRKK